MSLPAPYYQDEAAGITLYCGDCREILPHLGAVDCVITDPPWGISFNTSYSRFTDSAKGVRGHHHLRKEHQAIVNDDVPFDPSPFLGFSSVILWGANHFAQHLPSGTWFVWDKRANNGHAMLSDGEIAWWNKGRGVRIFDHCWHGFARSSENSLHYHPTQKPVALMRWCLSFVPDAHTILDPFSGSGTTLVAAKQLGRKAVGIEISEAYCKITVERLSQQVLPLHPKTPPPAALQEGLFT